MMQTVVAGFFPLLLVSTVMARASPSLQEISSQWRRALLRGDIHRELQREDTTQGGLRPCNELISTVTKAEMNGVAGVFLNTLLQDNEFLLNAAQAQIAAAVQYDFQVWKLCGTCESITNQVDDVDTATFGSYGSYCGTNFYGYNAEHSTLVMIPMETDNSTTSTSSGPPGGYLQGFVQMHQTESTASRAPTEVFPDSVAAELAALQQNVTEEAVANFISNLFLDTLTPMLAASAGAVAVVPDYLGYGESFATHNRTYFYHESYMQSATVSWLTAQSFVKSLSNGCSLLDDVVTISGASEGSFGTVSAAFAFRKLGINVLSAFPSAPTFSAEVAVAHTIDAYDSGSLSPQDDFFFISRVGLPLSVFVSSIDIPGLSNSFTGQRTVNPAWNIAGNSSRNVISWFASPNPVTGQEIALELAPVYVPEVLEPSLLGVFQAAANLSSPCASDFVTVGVNDKACENILDSNAYTMIAAADYPMIVCASANDTVATPQQVPSSIFENPFVQEYRDLFGNPVSGDHFATVLGCMISPITALTTATDGTSLTAIRPLSGSDKTVCEGTAAPTSAPTHIITDMPTQPTENDSSGVSVKTGLVAVVLGSFWTCLSLMA